MRKRILGLLTAALMLAAMSSAAAEEPNWVSVTVRSNEAAMIVDNGSDWKTRLNLREGPGKEYGIWARIYTGARVEIYEDDGEWALVGVYLGGQNVLTGYVMKSYLKPMGDDFSSLCPAAVIKTDTACEMEAADDVQLKAGDKVYVLAARADRYYVLAQCADWYDTWDGLVQGYVPASAVEPLSEPKQGERIIYRSFSVPSGGMTFQDVGGRDFETTWVGGVRLTDCWQMEGETQWHVTYGAGVQREPHIMGVIAENELSRENVYPFEGEVYAYEKSFIARVGTRNGKSILRRTHMDGSVEWALGDVPKDAVQLDSGVYSIRCEVNEVFSQAMVDHLWAYLRERRPLDERGNDAVSSEVLNRCSLQTSLVLDPCTGELTLHAWLEDTNGEYVTGGDLDAKTGEILRWGCDG